MLPLCILHYLYHPTSGVDALCLLCANPTSTLSGDGDGNFLTHHSTCTFVTYTTAKYHYTVIDSHCGLQSLYSASMVSYRCDERWYHVNNLVSCYLPHGAAESMLCRSKKHSSYLRCPQVTRSWVVMFFDGSVQPSFTSVNLSLLCFVFSCSLWAPPTQRIREQK